MALADTTRTVRCNPRNAIIGGRSTLAEDLRRRDSKGNSINLQHFLIKWSTAHRDNLAPPSEQIPGHYKSNCQNRF